MPESAFRKLIDEGLRATLASESFVTGRKFISLDAHPGSTYQLVADPDVPYIEVPSTVTGLEELQRDVAEAVAKLAKMDIDTLVVALTGIMHGTNTLVNERLPSDPRRHPGDAQAPRGDDGHLRARGRHGGHQRGDAPGGRLEDGGQLLGSSGVRSNEPWEKFA